MNFKSIRSIANADIGKLREIEKIGKIKAELIHKTLNDVYKS